MKYAITIIAILFFAQEAILQTINIETIKSAAINLGDVTYDNEDFTDFSSFKILLKDVEIVMLGEQSHGDGTAFDTKIKLVKYLHQEMDFDILVFESGFYDCHKAWEKINQGEDVRLAMAKSIYPVWSTTHDLTPLAKYLKKVNTSNKPLKLLGFDSQLSGKYAQEYLLDELSTFLGKSNPSILAMKEWEHFTINLNLLMAHDRKSLKKNNPEQDLAFLDYLINEVSSQKSLTDFDFWAQALKSIKAYYSDATSSSYYRDLQMADNLMWIKEKYPNRKIICWGATSHFLYNSKELRMQNPIIQLLAGKDYKEDYMMGHYIKNKYKERVFTIGFTAFQGRYGDEYNHKKIKPAKKGTLEYFLNASAFDNYLLSLKGSNVAGLKSRPIGYSYIKNDIDEFMDAIIFNRTMRQTRFDIDLYKMVYPENKYL